MKAAMEGGIESLSVAGGASNHDAPGSATATPLNRRPLRSRGSIWARWLAARLAGWGVSPDAVSAAGLAFAAVGALAMVTGSAYPELRRAALISAAAAIQLRLICNLLDGMIAVEHGRAGPLGPLWNEVPDRFSDAALMLGAGYAAARLGIGWAAPMGWFAALLAVSTAYVRELGRALGFTSDYGGPGAKPQRMALLTIAALVSLVEPVFWPKGGALALGVALISMASAATLAIRLHRLASALKQQSEA